MNKGGMFIRAKDLYSDIPLRDLHIHTRYSDGKSSIREYIERAAVRSYESLCFTDHVDFTTTWFDDYVREIDRENNASNGLHLFYGVEVRARDREGSLNAPDDIIDNAEMVVGVVHSIPSEDGKGKHKPEELSREVLLELEYSISLRLLENDRVSVLGHPMSNYEKQYGPVPESYYRRLISRANRTGKAVEINAKYKNDFIGFMNLCLELNPIISLGSDAHSINELGLVHARLQEALR
jgi:putative hydrolase